MLGAHHRPPGSLPPVAGSASFVRLFRVVTCFASMNAEDLAAAILTCAIPLPGRQRAGYDQADRKCDARNCLSMPRTHALQDMVQVPGAIHGVSCLICTCDSQVCLCRNEAGTSCTGSSAMPHEMAEVRSRWWGILQFGHRANGRAKRQL